MPKTAHFSNDHLHGLNHSKYKNHSFLVQDRFGLDLKMCRQPNIIRLTSNIEFVLSYYFGILLLAYMKDLIFTIHTSIVYKLMFCLLTLNTFCRKCQGAQ